MLIIYLLLFGHYNYVKEKFCQHIELSCNLEIAEMMTKIFFNDNKINDRCKNYNDK